MAQPTLPRSVYEETARLFYASGQNVARAARSAGLQYNTFSSRIRKARELGIITDKSKNEASVIEAKVVVKPVYRRGNQKSFSNWRLSRWPFNPRQIKIFCYGKVR